MRYLSALLLAATLTACGSDDPAPESSSPEPDPLVEARDVCREQVDELMQRVAKDDAPDPANVLSIDNGSLLVSTPEPVGERTAQFAFFAAGCVLGSLDAPGSVEQRMGSTTAMSGPGNGESFEASFDRV